jgi:hypothetical protein
MKNIGLRFGMIHPTPPNLSYKRGNKIKIPILQEGVRGCLNRIKRNHHFLPYLQTQNLSMEGQELSFGLTANTHIIRNLNPITINLGGRVLSVKLIFAVNVWVYYSNDWRAIGVISTIQTFGRVKKFLKKERDYLTLYLVLIEI